MKYTKEEYHKMRVLDYYHLSTLEWCAIMSDFRIKLAIAEAKSKIKKSSKDYYLEAYK